MDKLSLSALSMALILHTVMGVSYYFLLGRCTPGPLLGSWLFIACIGAVLQTVHIFPRWCRINSILCRLTVETLLCCLTLDVTHRVLVPLCHCGHPAAAGHRRAYFCLLRILDAWHHHRHHWQLPALADAVGHRITPEDTPRLWQLAREHLTVHDQKHI